MLDMDLLRWETLTGIIRDFEPEDLSFIGALQEESAPGQEISWDIKAIARDIDKFVGKHSPASRRNLVTIGQQHATLARFFSQKPVQGSIYLDTRNPGTLDRATVAEDQIARELEDESMLMDRQDNFMIARALQGSLTITVDDMPVTIDYKIPATNKFSTEGDNVTEQKIATTWEDPSADIKGDVKNIKLAVARKSGRKAKRAWCSTRTMTAMIGNDEVKEFVGRSVVGAQIIQQGYMGNFMGLDWFVSDETFIDANGVVTPYLDEKVIVVTPAPAKEWGFFRIGSDVIPKNDRSGMIEVVGKYSYSNLEINPPSLSLFAGYVRLPIVRLPGALGRAKVISG